MTEKWTISRLINWSADFFKSRGIDTPRLDAEILLAHILGVERIFLYVNFDQPMTANELTKYREAVKRRASREPVAYITGEKEFMGLKFSVSSAVLVPQPDTETIVLAAKERLADGARIADVCTGSGAIALSLLNLREDVSAAATDISKDALEIAKENAEKFGLIDRIDFFEGDLLSPILNETFDAIISNPPYIKSGEISSLPPEVRAEPRIALDGGADGLMFYRRLVADAPDLLRENGFLALEIGEDEPVCEIAQNSGMKCEEILKDLSGANRVVILKKI